MLTDISLVKALVTMEIASNGLEDVSSTPSSPIGGSDTCRPGLPVHLRSPDSENFKTTESTEAPFLCLVPPYSSSSFAHTTVSFCLHFTL